jgi:hypothetical protein
MDNLDSNTVAVFTVIAVLVLLAVAAWATQRRRQSERLQQRFGAEYAHTVDHMGSRDKAEAELLARERRVERLHLRALSRIDAERFAQEWKRLQARFVDDPGGSLAEADLVVRELMMVRGYPMGDFERRAADISVDHAAVVDHYRAAHAIAVRDESGAGETEDLRKAVVHYRALFDELLEVAPEPRRARQPNPHLMETR